MNHYIYNNFNSICVILLETSREMMQFYLSPYKTLQDVELILSLLNVFPLFMCMLNILYCDRWRRMIWVSQPSKYPPAPSNL